MKPLIRLFFRTLRVVLGPFMLLFEVLSRQKPVQRTAALQAQVDQDCRSLVLYHFKTCPFCIKVRKEMHRLALPVEKRDAQHDAANKADLLKGSGFDQVPCLKVTDANGQVQWIKDSGAIISYLNQRFGALA
ncbi:glutathione S-transferase N-terminal domain-containing protein [Rhodoferax sp. 4810]|nr:glutathione S-transferase N-terminal domain-containing protein [Rhodoferax jenense]